MQGFLNSCFFCYYQEMPKKNLAKSVRLGDNISPKKYFLSLKPDLEAHTFEGVERILVKIKKPTKTVVLHSKDLSIGSATFKQGKNFELATKISLDEKNETATFTFKNTLKAGAGELQIIFTGILNDSMRGFYRSTYTLDGKNHTMATTQFEATDARRAFPCFDEPAHKAVFHVDLVIPSDKTAISNMLPSEIREHEAGYKVVSFAPTPIMSTYLLAFLVGDFEYIEKKTKRGVTVRVYTTPGKVHQGKFALDVAVKCLEFYEKYFEIDYPLDTLDMIAVPDFSAGAMENWGAVTYRETTLLVDDDHSSSATRERVAIVIAHELAHQWFGNLVTMEWWTHLWLNEGFASYMEYLAVDKIFPEWNMWSKFVADDHNVALDLDSLSNTHPIEVEVHHPGEISEIFDEVSYSKGASVIRMLAEYLGYETFRKGLAYYLKKHSYKNTETVHLWEAFEKVSKKPVRKIMHGWTSRGGYPIVDASVKGRMLCLNQSRYFSHPKNKSNKTDLLPWMVPVTFDTDHSKPATTLFTKKSEKIIVPEHKWLKVNSGEVSFFRTKYDETLFQNLFSPIRGGRIGAIDRAGIIRDYSAFTESGVASTRELLELIRQYKNETDYTATSILVGALSKLNFITFGTKQNESVREFAREIIRPLVDEVGYDKKTGESHEDILRRALLLSSGASFDIPELITHAKKMWTTREKLPIDPNLRAFVYNTIAQNGNEAQLKQFQSLHKKETLHEEKNRLLRAMTRFRDGKILKLSLKYALSKDVRNQDAPMLISGVLTNAYGREIAWKFLKSNWKEILKRYGHGGYMLSRYIIKSLGGFSDEKNLTDIKKFFKNNPVPAGERSMKQVVEEIETNILWKKRVGKERLF
jgi:puromycin-sensitive aminopeptidase